MRRTIAALLLVAAFGGSMVPAVAHEQVVTDDADETIQLNLRKAVFDHDDRYLYATVYTYPAWRSGLMARRRHHIQVMYDTRGDRSPDYQVSLWFKDGRLVGQVYRQRGHGEDAHLRWIGHAMVRRTGPKGVWIRVRRSLVRTPGASVSWFVRTIVRNFGDQLPNNHHIKHQL